MGALALRRAAPHWPLALATAAAACVIFWDLGGPALWTDEGDTAFFARSIQHGGLPRAWNGTTFIDSDAGARLNSSLIMVGTPWLPYYLVAGSLTLFGQTEWGVRLPFALAGLACLPLVYLLLLRGTDDRLAAAIASAVLAGNLQFVLYARDGRYPILAMAFSLWLALETLQLGRRGAVWRWAAAAVLLFHTHPLPCLAGASTAAVWVWRRAPEHLERLGRATAIAAALTAPWLIVAAPAMKVNVDLLRGLGVLPPRLGQFGLEWLSVAPLLAWILIAAVNRDATGSALGEKTARREDLALYLMLHAGFSLAGSVATQSTANLNVIGLRYAPGMIALGAAATGLLLAPLWRRWPGAGSASFILLLATHLGGGTALWLSGTVEPDRFLTNGTERILGHAPSETLDQVLQTDWLAFLADLDSPSFGTMARASALLRARAVPEDILITNFEWEPLYFHTGLAQGANILPVHPSARPALAAALPDYVFSGRGASWLLWRWAWEGFQGYNFRDVARMLSQQGAVLKRAAALEETTWENRSNRNFRRYASVGTIYGRLRPPRPAELYRVYWGDEAARLRKSAWPRSEPGPSRSRRIQRQVGRLTPPFTTREKFQGDP